MGEFILNPCPICGHEVKVRSKGSDEDTEYIIECDNDYCSLSYGRSCGYDYGGIKRAWNIVAAPKENDDRISRKQAIEALTGWQTEPLDEDIVRTLESLPPVTPTEQQEHGRLIDADKLLQEMFTVDEEEWTTPEIRAILKNAPSVTPTERTGEWVGNHSGYWKCSECGLRVLVVAKGNYCPNCGAKMRSEK